MGFNGIVRVNWRECPCPVKLGHYDAANERSMRWPGSVILTGVAQVGSAFTLKADIVRHVSNIHPEVNSES